MRFQRRAVLAAIASSAAIPTIARGHVNRQRRLDEFVRDQMRAASIPGLALGLARSGEIVITAGYGYADLENRIPVSTDSMFHVASLSKTVTATAIVQLAMRGILDLDVPVTQYLDFPLVHPFHPDVAITIRQLLMHTSGISDEMAYEIDFRVRGRDAKMSLESLVRGYLIPGGQFYKRDKVFLTTAPGAAWAYSNIGYGLLGYIAEKISGEDMRIQTRDEIFRPLGMQHTSWTIADTPAVLKVTPYELVDGVQQPVEPVGFPDWPAGMIRSSIDDFTRFAGAIANHGTSSGMEIISAETTEGLLAMQRPPKLPDWLDGQALGWASSPLSGKSTINHWGGDPGVFTAAYLKPEEKLAACIFTNASATTGSRAAIKAIATKLFDFV